MSAADLATRLTEVRRHLPEILVDRTAFERLLRTATGLPGDVLAALELRLGADDPVVDLSIRLTHPAQYASILEPPVFAPLGNVVATWSAGPAEAAAVHSLWLEFDLDRDPGGRRPLPSLCLRLNRAFDRTWLVKTLLPRMQGRALTLTQEEAVERLLGRIPPAARLLYVFSMLPRESRPLRFEWLGLSGAQSLDAVRATAPESVPDAARLLPLFEDVDRLHLSLDVGPEGVLPRFGLEGSYQRLPHAEPRWRRLIERCVELGLSTPAKGEALLLWPGSERRSVRRREFLVRALSHLKIVAIPGRPPEAKAYLLVQHLYNG